MKTHCMFLKVYSDSDFNWRVHSSPCLALSVFFFWHLAYRSYAIICNMLKLTAAHWLSTSFLSFNNLMTKENVCLSFCSHKSNSFECIEELKSSAAPPHPLPLWFGGFIVTQALSPIDTSGNVPGEGQICCRIKLIYQMIECESKATLLEKMQKGVHGRPSSSHDTRMTWQCVCTCECM